MVQPGLAPRDADHKSKHTNNHTMPTGLKTVIKLTHLLYWLNSIPYEIKYM